MAFKADESFLQYLTMGAAGSVRVAAHLNGQGHRVVELERYTTSNKIWETKIKRLRVPDLLCLRCGLRIEARAKTRIEIKMSDSPNVAGRRWDDSLGDSDLVGFVQCTWTGENAIVADHVQYARVGDLRATVGLSKLGPPKSAGEGAERDRTWPAWAPSFAGRVVSVSSKEIVVVNEQGHKRSRPLNGDHPYCRTGDTFGPGSRLLSGVVPQPRDLRCPGETWKPISDLNDLKSEIRYAAVKALGLRAASPEAEAALEKVARTETEDSRIRLEAVAGLARHMAGKWVGELEGEANHAGVDMAMESVLILSELEDGTAVSSLAQIAAKSGLPTEVRAAAVWGLGIGGHKRPDQVLPSLADRESTIKVHAIVAMGRNLSESVVGQLVELLEQKEFAPAVIEVLVGQGLLAGEALLRFMTDGPTPAGSAWARYGLGRLGRDVVRAAAGARLDEGLERELEPLWLGVNENELIQGDTAILLRFTSRQLVRETIAPRGEVEVKSRDTSMVISLDDEGKDSG